MNLIIDVGNTLVKLAIFHEHELLEQRSVVAAQFSANVEFLLNKYPKIERGLISSVGSLPDKVLEPIKSRVSLLHLSHRLQLPFKNDYETPETLGVDRMALVAAACFNYPRQNVLVIDAGTCITYDFINDDNTYKGGAISPGIAMRYKSLHSFTAKLPLLQASLPKRFFGNNTQDSIHAGVMEGVLSEIQGFISRYEENFNDLTTILTGGDAHFLRDSIKNDIFANSNFLLEGLNYILKLNKD